MPSVDASLKKICYELPNSNFIYGDDEIPYLTAYRQSRQIDKGLGFCDKITGQIGIDLLFVGIMRVAVKKLTLFGVGAY